MQTILSQIVRAKSELLLYIFFKNNFDITLVTEGLTVSDIKEDNIRLPRTREVQKLLMTVSWILPLNVLLQSKFSSVLQLMLIITIK